MALKSLKRITNFLQHFEKIFSKFLTKKILNFKIFSTNKKIFEYFLELRLFFEEKIIIKFENKLKFRP